MSQTLINSCGNLAGTPAVSRSAVNDNAQPKCQVAGLFLSMEATVSLELGERDTRVGPVARLGLESVDEVFLYEKTQRLFKYASARDKQSVFKKELLDIKDQEQRTKLCRKTDERSNSLMHYAAKAGNLGICKFLCEEGADLHAFGQSIMTPLQFAARYGDERKGKEVWMCMEWIMEEEDNSFITYKEKEIFFDGRNDLSILHHAIQNTNWEEDPVVVQELIKTRKFKVTDADKQGNTCLHLAAQFDTQDDHTLLEAFLPSDDERNGFCSQDYIDWKDLEKCIVTENKAGMTPLRLACSVGNPDSVEQLLKIANNAESINVSHIINSPNSNGSLPMSLAITSRNLKMVDILMKKGAKVNEDTIITAARCVLLLKC